MTPYTCNKKEVMRTFGLPSRLLDRLAASGEIATIKLGKARQSARLYVYQSVVDWIDRQKGV